MGRSAFQVQGAAVGVAQAGLEAPPLAEIDDLEEQAVAARPEGQFDLAFVLRRALGHLAAVVPEDEGVVGRDPELSLLLIGGLEVTESLDLVACPGECVAGLPTGNPGRCSVGHLEEAEEFLVGVA